MSRAIGNPNVAPFLQERVKAFLAEKGWTQKDLAKSAGISTAQVSDLVRHAVGVGWYTAVKVGRVLGYAGMGDIEKAADEWLTKSGRVRTRTEAPTRRPQRHLREREEWDDVVRAVMSEKPYLSAASLERVGRIQDNEVDFPTPLPVSLIADLAHAFFAEHAKRTTKSS